jgi:hypothetical protein
MKIGLILSAVVGFIVLFVFLSFLFAWPVMALWNGCLVDAVDGVHQITWLQSWGLSILCSFLFKSTNFTSNKSD